MWRALVGTSLWVVLAAGGAAADPPVPAPVSQDRFVRLTLLGGSVQAEEIAPDFAPFSAAVGPLEPVPGLVLDMQASQMSALTSLGATGDLWAGSLTPLGEAGSEPIESASTSSFAYVFDVTEAGAEFELSIDLVYDDYTIPAPGGSVTFRGTGLVRLERLAPDPAVLVERTAGCAGGCREEGELPMGSYRLSAFAEVPHLPYGDPDQELDWSVSAGFAFSTRDPLPPVVPALPAPALVALAALLVATSRRRLR